MLRLDLRRHERADDELGPGPDSRRSAAGSEPEDRSASPDNDELLDALRNADREALLLNRSALVAALAKSHAKPGRTIMVSHDRLFGIDRDFPALALHFFGHRHGFKMTTRKGMTFVNVSALDDPVNGDSYTIIEIDGDRIVANAFRV